MDNHLRYREREQPTCEVGLGYDEFAEQTRPRCSGAIEELGSDHTRRTLKSLSSVQGRARAPAISADGCTQALQLDDTL